MADTIALAQLNLFSSIQSDYLEVLTKNLRPLHMDAGEILVEEGTKTRAPLFLVTDGELHVTRKDHDGQSHVLATLKPPTIVGEMEFLADVESSATVTAVSELKGFLLPRDRFEGLFANDEPAAFHLGLAIGRVVSERLAQTNQLLTKALSNKETLAKSGQFEAKNLDEVDDELEALLNS